MKKATWIDAVKQHLQIVLEPANQSHIVFDYTPTV